MDRFLKEPPLNISDLNPRQRRDKLNPANTTMAYLLEKTVGSRKEDQATWLLDYLKRLFPKGGHLKQVVEDFQTLDDFSILSKSKRKTYWRSHFAVALHCRPRSGWLFNDDK